MSPSPRRKPQRRPHSTTTIPYRAPTREEVLQLQHQIMKYLTQAPLAWHDDDTLWYLLTNLAKEDVRKELGDDKKRMAEYPYAFLALRDLITLLKELHHQGAIRLEKYDGTYKIRRVV